MAYPPMASRIKTSILAAALSIPYVIWCVLALCRSTTTLNWAAFPLVPFRVTAIVWHEHPILLIVAWTLAIFGTAFYGWLISLALKKSSSVLAIIADVWLIFGSLVGVYGFILIGFSGGFGSN